MRDYLKKLRDEHGLTAAETAKKLDISESYYSLIENGKRQEKMDLVLAAKISAIFSIELSEVLAQETAFPQAGGEASRRASTRPATPRPELRNFTSETPEFCDLNV